MKEENTEVCVVTEGVAQQDQFTCSHTGVGGLKGKHVSSCHSYQRMSVRVGACPHQTQAAD